MYFNISNAFEIIESTVPNFAISVNPESVDICSDSQLCLTYKTQFVTNLVSLSIDIPENSTYNFDPPEVEILLFLHFITYTHSNRKLFTYDFSYLR